MAVIETIKQRKTNLDKTLAKLNNKKLTETTSKVVLPTFENVPTELVIALENIKDLTNISVELVIAVNNKLHSHGVKAQDIVEGDITDKIKIEILEDLTVQLSVSDKHGNEAVATIPITLEEIVKEVVEEKPVKKQVKKKEEQEIVEEPTEKEEE